MNDEPCRRGCIRAGTETDALPARHGAYCSRCWGRIDQALLQAPELAAHLISSTIRSGGNNGDKVDNHPGEAPLPFNENAFNDVNELYSLLVYWRGVWADYLEEKSWTPRQSWRRASGTIAGLPAGTTADDAAGRVRLLTNWFRERLDMILTLAPEDVDEFDEAIKDVWRMNARWPRLDRPRFADMPCPKFECGARVAVYPPTFGPWVDKQGVQHAGDTHRIVCEQGHWFPDEEFESLLTEWRERRVQVARAQGVADRLVRKYMRGLGLQPATITEDGGA